MNFRFILLLIASLNCVTSIAMNVSPKTARRLKAQNAQQQSPQSKDLAVPSDYIIGGDIEPTSSTPKEATTTTTTAKKPAARESSKLYVGIRFSQLEICELTDDGSVCEFRPFSSAKEISADFSQPFYPEFHITLYDGKFLIGDQCPCDAFKNACTEIEHLVRPGSIVKYEAATYAGFCQRADEGNPEKPYFIVFLLDDHKQVFHKLHKAVTSIIEGHLVNVEANKFNRPNTRYKHVHHDATDVSHMHASVVQSFDNNLAHRVHPKYDMAFDLIGTLVKYFSSLSKESECINCKDFDREELISRIKSCFKDVAGDVYCDGGLTYTELPERFRQCLRTQFSGKGLALATRVTKPIIASFVNLHRTIPYRARAAENVEDFQFAAFVSLAQLVLDVLSDVTKIVKSDQDAQSYLNGKSAVLHKEAGLHVKNDQDRIVENDKADAFVGLNKSRRFILRFSGPSWDINLKHNHKS